MSHMSVQYLAFRWLYKRKPGQRDEVSENSRCLMFGNLRAENNRSTLEA